MSEVKLLVPRRPAAAVQQSYTPLPERLQRALYWALLIGGLISTVFVGEFSPVPMTLVLDVWILSVGFWVVCWGRTHTRWALVIVIAYSATRLFGALLTAPPLEDFLQAHRWLIYLGVFALARGHRWTRHDLLIRLTWWLISLATLKASLTLLLVGSGERPGLFVENNFELALFSGMAAVIYRSAGSARIGLVVLLGALTLLSGSRSGAVAYAVLMAYALWTSQPRDVFQRFLAVLTPVVAVVIAWLIFESRAAESQVIDRVRFWDILQTETIRWDWKNWLLGTPPITPLSQPACRQLEFYESLFSSAGDGHCYSVILHSHLMRLLYDGGLLALALAFTVPLVLMRRERVAWPLALTLMTIVVTNSFSVSGLNNPYVALPLLLAMLSAAEPRTRTPSRPHLTIRPRPATIGRPLS